MMLIMRPSKLNQSLRACVECCSFHVSPRFLGRLVTFDKLCASRRRDVTDSFLITDSSFGVGMVEVVDNNLKINGLVYTNKLYILIGWMTCLLTCSSLWKISS